MTPAVEQLVRETMELTGADTPELLQDGAPVLADAALEGDDVDGRAFYLVGIIGGKDVGKSALVNALVGRPITAITSHGPGTETVVAYAHASREPGLRALLEREVPGQFRIVTHDSPQLLRQVLLDLPDIDSHWRAHLEVTRTMLRHMLYPVWVQSVEKYADRQPQEMLARVAAGNAAQNFVFCLNKVDQVEDSEGGDQGSDVKKHGDALPAAAGEIRDDFARRIARTVLLSSPPEIFLISAIRPEDYDLPRLRAMLSRQKPDDAVRRSKDLAGRRQDRSLIGWLREQRLSERAARLARLQQEAEEAVAARIGEPLLERAIPGLLDDPAARLAMTDAVLRERVARWPLVNLVHTLLSPLLAVWRSNVGPGGGRAGAGSADAMVDAYLAASDPSGGLPRLVQTTFARLRQSQPTVAELYQNNRLWEDMPAELAVGELRRTLAASVERQREVALERLSGRNGIVAPLFRWLLTVGALLWFPFIQPVLQGMLSVKDRWWDIWTHGQDLARLLIGVLSGESLLKNVTFLILWFVVIWLSLRWSTQRRVGRFLARMRAPAERDASLNLSRQAIQWMDDLLGPVRTRAEHMADVAQRVNAIDPSAGAAA